jgi:hypothetical protein
MTRERDALLNRIKEQLPTQSDAFERLVDRRESKARRSRITAGALGVGVTVALISGLVVWSPFTGDDRATDRVQPGGSTVPLVAGSGEYYYLRLVSYDSKSGLGNPSSVWIGPDGSGRLLTEDLGEPRDERFGPGQMPGSFLPELSADPNELLQQLIERGSPGGASPNPIASSSPGRSQEMTSLLRTLQDLLTLGGDAFLTPEQIAGVFEAAQGLNEVTTEPGVSDPLGRPAVRLSFVIDYDIGSESTIQWYFEPTTGQFMGEVWVNGRTEDAEQATLIETAGIAGSVDDRPAPDARYVPEGKAQPTFLESAGGSPKPVASPTST